MRRPCGAGIHHDTTRFHHACFWEAACRCILWFVVFPSVLPFFFFAATVVGKICSVCGGFGAVFVKTIMRIRVAACFRRDRRGIVSDTNKLIRISICWTPEL